MGSPEFPGYCSFTKAIEHLGDRWSLLIVRQLGASGTLGFNELARSLPGRISRSVLTTRLREVCRECNGGWMSEMEKSVKPFLGPMVRGMSVLLNNDNQDLLAAWLVKTYLMLNLPNNNPGVKGLGPIYEYLYGNKAPKPGYAISIGHYSGEAMPVLLNVRPFWMRRRGETEEEKRIHCHSAILIIGQFLAQIIYSGAPELAFNRKHPQLRRIWPGSGGAFWPSAGPISFREAERISFSNSMPGPIVEGAEDRGPRDFRTIFRLKIDETKD